MCARCGLESGGGGIRTLKRPVTSNGFRDRFEPCDFIARAPVCAPASGHGCASAPLSSSAHPRFALVGAALPDTRAGGQASGSMTIRELDEQIRGRGLGDLIVANLYCPWPQPRTTPTVPSLATPSSPAATPRALPAACRGRRRAAHARRSARLPAAPPCRRDRSRRAAETPRHSWCDSAVGLCRPGLKLARRLAHGVD
jgi:hypothetical protein